MAKATTVSTGEWAKHLRPQGKRQFAKKNRKAGKRAGTHAARTEPPPARPARPTDVQVVCHGSLWLVDPLTEAARAWITEHVPDDAQWWASRLVVEPRYVHDLVVGMRDDGLEVR